MSRLYPEHERRMRRVGLACVLGSVAAMLAFGVMVLHSPPAVDWGPSHWLWRVLAVCVLGLATVASILILTAERELRKLIALSRIQRPPRS